MVKPLLLRILRESRVPKKSMFTRAFGVFYFLGECSRCPAPKRRALPTAPHPEIFSCSCLQLSAALPVETKSLYIKRNNTRHIISDFFSCVKSFSSIKFYFLKKSLKSLDNVTCLWYNHYSVRTLCPSPYCV